MSKATEQPTKPLTLRIQDFAQIRDVDLTFGDLTVLVGPQGSGKSLSLQWLKLALDGRHILRALRDAGETPQSFEDTLDLVFGATMWRSWRATSRIEVRGEVLRKDTLGRRGRDKECVYYVPAHRSLLLADGWPQPFQKLPPSTPVVARMFSQALFEQFNHRGAEHLFPFGRVLKQEYKDLLDAAIFHSGTVDLERANLARRLKLSIGEVKLDYQAWTAGQREFAPLLLGLYRLLPAQKVTKEPGLDYVIIEEPEMGLHPKAISAFLALTLELLKRGYRVVISTHSPDLLTAVWMLQRLKQLPHGDNWKLLAKALGLPESQAMRTVTTAALEKDYKAYALDFEGGQVRSYDISKLDPDADDDHEAEWGGLTGFSSRFGDAVRAAVNGAL